MSHPEASRRPQPYRTPGSVLGLGLDGDDGHRRVTKGEEFLLLGGSAETHERMQDLVMRMKERLSKSGRSFQELTAREFRDLAHDVWE